MIKTDQALNNLRDVISSLGMSFSIVSLDAQAAKLNVEARGTQIPVWFKEDIQKYGFDMMNGGEKVYDTLDDFARSFKTYYDINVVFIPTAKKIIDDFEQYKGISTAFDSFSGNRDDGYIAHFLVLGMNDCYVNVKRMFNDRYDVRVLQYDAGGKKSKCTSNYVYSIADNGLLELMPTISLYMDMLHQELEGVEGIHVNRVARDEFRFSYNSHVITVRVVIINDKIYYDFLDIDGDDVEGRLQLENPYDVTKLYDEFLKTYRSNATVIEEAIVTDNGGDLEAVGDGEEKEDLSSEDVEGVGAVESAEDAGFAEDAVADEDVGAAEDVEEKADLSSEDLQSEDDGSKSVEDSESAKEKEDLSSEDLQSGIDESEVSKQATEEQELTTEEQELTTEESEQAIEEEPNVTDEQHESTEEATDSSDESVEIEEEASQASEEDVQAEEETAQDGEGYKQSEEGHHEDGEEGSQIEEEYVEGDSQDGQDREEDREDVEEQNNIEDSAEKSEDNVVSEQEELPDSEEQGDTEDTTMNSSEISAQVETVGEETVTKMYEVEEVKIMTKGNPVFVLFITKSDGMFKMTMEKAESIGLPAYSIVESTQINTVRGIDMTDEEKAAHTIAKDITNNDEVCNALLASLFA